LGWFNDNIYFLISTRRLGTKRLLNYKIKFLSFMSIILKIFPYASPEIITTALSCFFMTLFGLSLGFALLKIQGE